MIRQITLVVLAGASLAACGIANAPHRKPGYWQETIQSDRRPAPVVTKWCWDAESDRQMPIVPRAPRRAGFCQKFSVSHTATGYVVDNVCGFGGMKIIGHAVLTGDFTTHYTAVNTVDIENSPDPAHDGRHTVTLTAVYKGPTCPPEMQPGQMERPDGQVIDIAQLRGHGGPGGGGGGGRSGGGM